MNSETQKQSFMKVALVSGVACIAWMFVVKPAFQGVLEQKQTVSAHENLIVAYKERTGSLDSHDSVVIQEQLATIIDTMSGSITEGDSGTLLHTLINDCAGRSGVSVSRIESVNVNQLEQKVEGIKGVVHGINHTVRVEFEGDYGSVITFMDDVVSGPIQVKFVSFRFIAIGHESVRVNAEVYSVMLTSIPSGSDLGGSDDE